MSGNLTVPLLCIIGMVSFFFAACSIVVVLKTMSRLAKSAENHGVLPERGRLAL